MVDGVEPGSIGDFVDGGNSALPDEDFFMGDHTAGDNFGGDDLGSGEHNARMARSMLRLAPRAAGM